MRKFQFVNVDVFTRTPLEGNQLCVITNAPGLSDAEMRAIARETRLSETTFIFPRDAAVERERGVKVRIFTVEQEMPFAGHPTLGTAYVLARANGASEVALDLPVGKIPVAFAERDGEVFGEMTQRDPEFGRIHDPRVVADATGLPIADIDSNFPIETVSTGFAFAIVPIRTLAAIRALRPEWRRADEYLKRTDASLFYFVTQETEDRAAKLHARMIFYGGEDPSTGSAAGCTAAWMVKHSIAQSGEQAIIEQGIEARRPSQIYVRASRTDSGIREVRVGGYVVEVMRGEITL